MGSIIKWFKSLFTKNLHAIYVPEQKNHLFIGVEPEKKEIILIMETGTGEYEIRLDPSQAAEVLGTLDEYMKML